MKDLKERAIKATKLFLERRGYEVIETGWDERRDPRVR